MYQLGIKGEAYGKCIFIEYEWLVEFMHDLEYLSQTLTRLRALEVEGWSKQRERAELVEYIITRFSGLYYGIHNYFDENIETMVGAVDYLVKRYDELRLLSVYQKRALCKCEGCRQLAYIVCMNHNSDDMNKIFILDALRGAKKNA